MMQRNEHEGIGWLILIPLTIAILAAWGFVWALQEVGSHLAPLLPNIALVRS